MFLLITVNYCSSSIQRNATINFNRAMAKIHKQHTFEVYSSRPQSDDITHAHPTTHQLADKLHNEHSMPVSRVAVHSVNGGHKLVHNTSAQKRKLIFRVFFW